MATTTPPLDPDATTRRVRERLALLIRAASSNVSRNVIMQNPVDTGYSRANWRMSVNEIDRSVSTPPSSQQRAENARKKGWYPHREPSDADIAGVDAGDVVFITNSVGYMKYLEEGSSRQAPAHFIKNIALAEQAKISRTLRSIR